MKPWVKIYKKAIVTNPTLNRTIAKISKLLIHLGHPPLILALHTGHLRRLKGHHEVVNTKATILEGRIPLPVRAGVVRAFCEDKDRAILASTIFDEGEDIPQASALMLAGGGKSRVNLIQRIGRVSRKKEDNSCVVIDFSHSHNVHTARHALARLKECKSQGWEIVHVKSIEELFQLLRDRRARVHR